MQNNTTDNEINRIELDKAQAEEHISLAKSLDRLTKNRDFKKVVLECYLKDEPVRLAYLRSDPNFTSETEQADLVRQIDSVAFFREFLRGIRHFGAMAQNAMNDYEEALDELRAEDGDDA